MKTPLSMPMKNDFRKEFDFDLLQIMPDCLKMRFWARPNLFHECPVMLGGDKLPFRCGRTEFSESLPVFGNIKLLFDCFQIWFSGSAARWLNLFARN